MSVTCPLHHLLAVLMFNLTVVPQESVEGTRVLARILATVEYEIDFMVSFVITDGTAIR